MKTDQTDPAAKQTFKVTGDSKFELRINRFTRVQHIAMLACGILAVLAVLLYIAVTITAPPSTETESSPAVRKPARPESSRSPAPRTTGRLSSIGPSSSPREVSIWDSTRDRSSAPTPSTTARSGSTEEARRSLDQVIRMLLNNKTLTPEQAGQINAWLANIAEQGAAAVPAIADYLRRNENFNFDSIAGGEHIQYGSLRLGLLDALSQVDSAAAAALALELLPNTTDPLEIALLSRTFVNSSDDEYRQAAMSAALRSLELAASGQWDGRDVGPLFETLQRFGDATAAEAVREVVNRWNYYATLTLAGMPNGEGIPSLIQLATDPTVLAMGTGDFALRPLAQMAMQYPAARDALISQARAQQIPDTAWPGIASALAGNHIQYGIQIFGSTAAPVTWSTDQINRRIALIDQLINSGINSTAMAALQASRAQLVARLQN